MHPNLVKHIFYPVHERLVNRPTFTHLAELEKTQWLSREAIERLQMEKLHALLHTANAHSPWHAERIRASAIDLATHRTLTFDDLRRLPTMNKADASANRERIVWRDIPGGAFRYNTGGSSGQPLIFYFGRKRQAADAASRMRARRWWKVEIGDPEIFLWGAPVELNKTDLVKKIRDRLFNQLLLNAFDMSESRMSDYLRIIQSFNPACIYGYASSLSLLASYAKSQNRIPKLRRLKVVCTTGEPLFPEQRALIEEVFDKPVSNEYGCRDGGLIALESPQGQMLVNSETLIVEILDDKGMPVAPGEIGEVVVTNLCSDAQPFIRYRTGDMARQADDSCSEKRGLHVISEIMGRTTDFVVRPDGTIMHALAVIYVLRAIEGVHEFKIVQPSTNRMDVMVVPNSTWRESAKDEIVKQLQNRMGRDVTIEINMVDKIAPEASGKYRYVISHVPLPERLDLRS
ncbi:phenylacetate--CoA ligase family protein [Methylocaldum sp.]|uniref:phenylacetate--CoA ligase family protein n=1 Tax=Methylocaldum sp. TaxID=1969727 RepID=UPI002D53436D|nr:phenylacetate--CoA ligase family protein [Methylocaldum sp.]HYE35632.1 phenylacetate--CoA ligase family protein [Methylocaldum sp.]